MNDSQQERVCRFINRNNKKVIIQVQLCLFLVAKVAK